MRNLGFVALLALGMLTACATTTPYQPVRDGYGYQDQRIEGNRYLVTFAGSTATPRQTVENYLLYHAAELTLASGNDYFIVPRSEEHTSELQSLMRLSYAVFCLQKQTHQTNLSSLRIFFNI